MNLKWKKKQKDRTLKLDNARKLSNTGNGVIDAIKQNNCHTSSCRNVHDTMIEIVQDAFWALRVWYEEVSVKGFVGQ